MREKLEGNIDREISRSDILRYLIAGIVVEKDGQKGLHESVLSDMPEFLTVEGSEVMIDPDGMSRHDKESREE
jgi:hypothetical protein